MFSPQIRELQNAIDQEMVSVHNVQATPVIHAQSSQNHYEMVNQALFFRNGSH